MNFFLIPNIRIKILRDLFEIFSNVRILNLKYYKGKEKSIYSSNKLGYSLSQKCFFLFNLHYNHCLRNSCYLRKKVRNGSEPQT